MVAIKFFKGYEAKGRVRRSESRLDVNNNSGLDPTENERHPA